MATPTILGAIEVLFAAPTVLNTVVPGDLFEPGQTLSDLVPSGLWVGDIPEEMAFPFVALLHQGETLTLQGKPGLETEGRYYEDTKLRFQVFAPVASSLPSANPTELLCLAIKGVMDDAILDVIEAEHFVMLRQRYELTLDRRRAPDDRRVYRGTIDYTATIHRHMLGRPLDNAMS